jgi:hypothetical protein
MRVRRALTPRLPSNPQLDRRTARPGSVERFMPLADVRECHETLVHAPAALVFEVAESFDLQSLALVRLVFRARGWLLGSSEGPPPRREALLEAMRGYGWGTLARVPGRALVMGAVTQPWLADVTFRSVRPDRFARYAEHGAVKIVWTIEAIPLGPVLTRLRTQTRVLAPDAATRARFQRYWWWARIGIRLIRWLVLPAIRREAERRRAASRGEAVHLPADPRPHGTRW